MNLIAFIFMLILTLCIFISLKIIDNKAGFYVLLKRIIKGRLVNILMLAFIMLIAPLITYSIVINNYFYNFIPFLVIVPFFIWLVSFDFKMKWKNYSYVFVSLFILNLILVISSKNNYLVSFVLVSFSLISFSKIMIKSEYFLNHKIKSEELTSNLLFVIMIIFVVSIFSYKINFDILEGYDLLVNLILLYIVFNVIYLLERSFVTIKANKRILISFISLLLNTVIV